MKQCVAGLIRVKKAYEKARECPICHNDEQYKPSCDACNGTGQSPQGEIDSWIIWSNEHYAYWAPNECGYRTHIDEAGRYTFKEALRICNSANYKSEDGIPYPKMSVSKDDILNEVMCPSP